MGSRAFTPYCGRPPTPAGLWDHWNLDPILIGVLLVALCAYGLASRRQPAIPAWRRWTFVAGWAILTAALVSPLCPLSVALFSARVGQHMVLSLVAAPLLVLGRAADLFPAPWRRVLPWSSGLRTSFGAIATASAVGFTLAVWFWHAPGPYDATFASNLIYWLMHLTVIGTALALWSVLLDSRPDRTVTVLAVGAVSTLQMTFLGALITLTPRLLYAPHALTPYAWGLTRASDQQLGGLIMWVPGCSIFLTITVWTLARMMAERSHPAALA